MATYNTHQTANKGSTNGTNIQHGGNQYGYIENFHTHAPDSSFKSEADKAREVMRWISPRDFTTTYGQLLDSVVPGTGQWFLQSEEFKAWRSKDKKYLWVSGKPGAGKSFLSTIVIDELKRSQARQFAFLYLSYTEEPSVKDLLGNLASQLIAQRINSSEVPDPVYALWGAEENKIKPFENAPELSTLEQLLSALVTDDTYLVIDALDEFDSSQKQNLLTRLRGIQNANLLITSRDNKKPKGFESIDVITNENDIKDYINRAISFSNLSRLVDQDSTLREEIMLEVTKKADGIFLLPRLHMGALALYHAPGDVRKALRNLPHDKNSAYDKTVEHIKKQDKMGEWALTAIGWIVHAQKTIEVEELRHALLIGGAVGHPLKSGDAQFDHGELLSKEAILASCCGLVEIGTDPSGWDVFRLIHYSAQEFFEANKEEHFLDFHSRISLACAKYVCIPRLAYVDRTPENPYTNKTLQDGRNNYAEEYQEYQRLKNTHWKQKMVVLMLERLRRSEARRSYSNGQGVLRVLDLNSKFLLYPFINYVIVYLSHHFSHIDEDDNRSIVEEQICRLVQNEASRNFYLDLVHYDHTLWDSFFLSLYLVAEIGSSRLVEKYIGDGFPLPSTRREWQKLRERRREGGKGALEVAISHGNPGVAKVILGLGDVADLTKPFGHSLLFRAAKGNSTGNFCGVVNQVVDDIRTHLETLEQIETSKSWTSRFCDRLARELHPPHLPNHHFGAINPIKLGDHIRMLSASSRGDYDEISELLGKRRVVLLADNTNMYNSILRTKYYLIKTAFFLAIENCHTKVVEALLDHGFDVNSRNYNQETPLHRAVWKSSVAMVKLLLNYNPQMNLVDGLGDTPCRWVKDDGIFMLLIKASTSQPSSTLSFASQALLFNALGQKRTDLVKVALENGLNHSVRGKHGETPLYKAVIIEQYFEGAKVLLEYNADPNLLDEGEEDNLLDSILGNLETDSKLLSELPPEDAIEMGPYYEKKIQYWKDVAELLKAHGAKTAQELKSSSKAESKKRPGEE